MLHDVEVFPRVLMYPHHEKYPQRKLHPNTKVENQYFPFSQKSKHAEEILIFRTSKTKSRRYFETIYSDKNEIGAIREAIENMLSSF